MSVQSEGILSGCLGRLYWRAWKPEAAARALLVFVHGFAEHSGRYEHVAGYFTGSGYACYAFDQAGHGKSEGARGYINAFGDYLSDLWAFIALAQEREAPLPTFLVGHSMGGLVSLAYGEQQPTELRGMLVSAPGLQVARPLPAWKGKLAEIVSVIVPTLAMPNGIAAAYLSHDPAITGAYAQVDPLVFHTATARWYSEFTRAGSETLANALRFTLPCLLMQGGDDRLISPEGTKQFYAAAGSADKSLKIYDGFYHEIFNEIGKERVFADMAAWLDQHLSA